MKTAEDLIVMSLALKNENKDNLDLYMGVIFPIVNSVLLQNFDGNNNMRQSRGEILLEQCPEIENLNDEIPYEPYYLNTVMPYGIAAQLFTDDSMSQAHYFEQKYQNMRAYAMKTVATSIEDSYGGE